MFEYILLKWGYLIHYNYVSIAEGNKNCNSPNMKKKNKNIKELEIENSDKEDGSKFLLKVNNIHVFFQNFCF